MALTILVIALLTMVGYVATIHRAAREGKSQAVASMYARTMMEQIRDSRSDFESAASTSGLVRTQDEVLLEGEDAPENDETHRKSPTTYQVEGRVTATTSSIYNVVVRATWREQGRDREVVLESRLQSPPR